MMRMRILAENCLVSPVNRGVSNMIDCGDLLFVLGMRQ